MLDSLGSEIENPSVEDGMWGCFYFKFIDSKKRKDVVAATVCAHDVLFCTLCVCVRAPLRADRYRVFLCMIFFLSGTKRKIIVNSSRLWKQKGLGENVCISCKVAWKNVLWRGLLLQYNEATFPKTGGRNGNKRGVLRKGNDLRGLCQEHVFVCPLEGVWNWLHIMWSFSNQEKKSFETYFNFCGKSQTVKSKNRWHRDVRLAIHYWLSIKLSTESVQPSDDRQITLLTTCDLQKNFWEKLK